MSHKPGYLFKYAYLRECESSWLPTEAFRDVVDPVVDDISTRQCKWYLYGHYMDGEIKYIGKGSGKRVANFTRTQKWIDALCKAKTFDARILSWHDTEQDAYLTEMAMICMLMPELNGKFREKMGRVIERGGSLSDYFDRLLATSKTWPSACQVES